MLSLASVSPSDSTYCRLISTNSTGPIVDVAVPALQAIFSDGSAPSSPAPSSSAPPPSPKDRIEQPANIINLHREEKDISEVLTSCQKIQDTLSLRINEVAGKIDRGVADLQQLIRHDQFKSLHVQVISAV